MATQPRGFIASILDRAATWLLGFPPETCNYSITPVKIPVGSDTARIELLADLYRPTQQPKPSGTILVRTPYGRSAVTSIGTGRAFAPRGYQVLIVSCRGTFGSGGDIDPFRTETEDGLAVVAWMRRQDWYTGTFATLGTSYAGFTQLALMCGEDKLEDMVAAVIHVGPHDMTRKWWGTGAFSMDTLPWVNVMVWQEKGLYASAKALYNVAPLYKAVPLSQGVKNFSKIRPPDPYYKPVQLEQALERASCPVLLVGGWYDLFIEQTFEQYTRLNKRGVKVGLVIGPWDHTGAINSTSSQKFLAWMEEHLAGRPQKDERLVQYYVTGAQEWRSDVFPPSTKSLAFHLQSENGLSIERPRFNVETCEFTYDPRNPTPTIGGNTLVNGGSKDDSALATRSDVLAFTTDPLPEDLDVIGQITVELKHSTDNPYADLFVRISEVQENGKSFNITETYKRLDPARKEGIPVTMTLDPCAHRFLKGRKVRLIVAAGSNPHWYRNAGVYDPNCSVGIEEMQSVKHMVHFGSEALSKVVFPVADDAAKSHENH